MSEHTEAEAVAKLAGRSLEPRAMKVDGVPHEVLLVPSGNGSFTVVKAKELAAPYLKAPERRQGEAILTDLASFCAHVKRFASSESVIFADRTSEAPSLLAVLDYHPAGPENDRAAYGHHRARYPFPLSEEWKAWTGADGESRGQADFARFLEDHLADVLAPDVAGKGAKAFVELLSCGFASASKLLELSRGLTVRVGSRVSQVVNLQSGEGRLEFSAEHAGADGKPLNVPGAFLLGVPVFRNGALYQIPARLRYRVNGGSVTWSFDLYRSQAVFDHAVDEACAHAAKETGLPLFMGSPEK